MDRTELLSLLEQVAGGAVSPGDAANRMGGAATAELGYATLDLRRGMRQGVSEVIYGESKTPEQIAGIVAALVDHGQSRILATRVDEDKAARCIDILRDGLAQDMRPHYDPLSRLLSVGEPPKPDGNGYIMVACAGTSDLGVAEEAAVTAEFLGNRVIRTYDVGVAGIHRLLAHGDDIAGANVIVAVAGMEGALPSVVAGLAACPVIAVPTSVGYGASFGGVTALLAMLNCCASGVSVVNIDNGFGAGYQASLINHSQSRPKEA